MLDDDVTLESERSESAALTRSREEVVAKLQAGYSGFSDVSALTPYKRPKGANPPPPPPCSKTGEQREDCPAPSPQPSRHCVCVLGSFSFPFVPVSDTHL